MRTKHTFTAMACMMLLLLSACTNPIEEENIVGSRRMSFSIGFTVSDSPFTRALSDNASTLALYDYKDGALENSVTQSKEDTGFGTMSIDMSYGTHSLVFVAHNTDECTFNATSSLLSFSKVTDTFAATSEVEISMNSPESIEVTLERQVAKIRLVIKDAIPENAAKIGVNVQEYSDELDPFTGYGATGYSYTREWTYSEVHIGTTETSYGLYTFVPADNYTSDVTITISDSNGTAIAKETLHNVPLKKNRTTSITGYMFMTTTGVQFSVTSEWDEGIDVPF